MHPAVGLVFGLVAAAAGAAAAAAYNASIRPLVLWHGLGDSYLSAGMAEFAKEVQGVHPGLFIHSVHVEEGLEADQRAGFFGDVNEQLARVADQLAAVPELAHGFDALGFSQGGQFLRAYAERHAAPPVRNLITFGAQHMGVSDMPACRPGEWTCELARRAARRGVYTHWAQHNLVSAQYFRDPARLPTYRAVNTFLADINNEGLPDARNATYAARLAALDALVLVLFAQDTTVVPKESSWFGSEAPPDDAPLGAQRVLGARETIVPMRAHPLYTEDWIGLRALDECGRVFTESCDGPHMHLPRECWEWIVRRWTGGPADA